MKGKGRLLPGDLGKMLAERSFYGALALSLALHALLFLLWEDRPSKSPTAKPSLMVARLVRGAFAEAPTSSRREEVSPRDVQERGGESGGAEEVPGEVGGDGAPPSRDGTGSSLQVGTPTLTVGLAPSGRARGVLAAGDSPPLEATAGSAFPAATAGRSFEAVMGTTPGMSDPRGKGDVTVALAEIRRRIESKKTYPLLARKNGWEGSVLVEIEFGGDGEFEGVRLLHESGFPILDRATLAAVKEAVPFPPLPGKVRVPVSYRLDRN